MTVHVYAGPTLPVGDVLDAVPEAIVHPPVRHGDLWLLDPRREDTVLIIDGVLRDAEPVRHKEILDVLGRGTRVMGAAGLGALRAAELGPYGMRGVGHVFSMYRGGALDADDEVAVEYPPCGFPALTLALVNLRWALVQAVARRLIPEDQAAPVLHAARQLHYTRRNWAALLHRAELTCARTGEAARTLRRFTAEHPRLADLQREDALLALEQTRAEHAPDAAGPARAALTPRTCPMERERGAHRPAVPARRVPIVSERDVLGFQQVYDPDFPARYRRYALERITWGVPAGADRDPVRVALSAVGAAPETAGTPETTSAPETTAAHLPQETWDYWLTPREQREQREQREDGARHGLLRLLVRSFRVEPGVGTFHGVPVELRGGERAWAAGASAVAAADLLNEHVARSGTHRVPDRVPAAVVRRHLADVWKCGDSAELLAAARDRGFVSLAEAEQTARRFLALHGVRATQGRP
ncbi:TfuA-like protein [Streptomyces sp. NPDC059445]|uniref:TfuA-like protein n=1 Tax=Streptomyces sp. NPDC059445 TaxID=3346832 RepID=UPI0036CAA423